MTADQPGSSGRTPSPRTEYRVICDDGKDWHDMAMIGVEQSAWVPEADSFGCGPHHVIQRTIYTTPWTRTPARTPSDKGSSPTAGKQG